jgi:hypothetical protein
MAVRVNQATMCAGRHPETHKSEGPRHINKVIGKQKQQASVTQLYIPQIAVFWA